MFYIPVQNPNGTEVQDAHMCLFIPKKSSSSPFPKLIETHQLDHVDYTGELKPDHMTHDPSYVHVLGKVTEWELE
jgi:hypothetical protein